MLKAGVGRCEEAAIGVGDGYIPCNKPAVRMVGWPGRGEGPYRMCEMCAHHNVKNRGAADAGPYEGPVDETKELAAASQSYAAKGPGGLTPEQLAALGTDAAHHKADLSSGDLLTRISATVREIIQARADVQLAEDALKGRQQHLRTLEEHTLAELMREAGQEMLRTTDGHTVELKEKLRAGIPEARFQEAVMWLKANGYGSIVKREIKLAFGKEEDQKAAQAYDLVVEAGFSPTDKQTVHVQTLQASIKEMLDKGMDVPMDLLGAYAQPFVSIKEAKR